MDYTMNFAPMADGYRGMAELLDLSDDVLLYILNWCSPRDLKALGHTCPRLGTLVCDRTLWQRVDARSTPMGKQRLRWLLTHCLSPATTELKLTGYANRESRCLGIQDLTWPHENEQCVRGSRLGPNSGVDMDHFLLRMWYPLLPRFAVSPRWPDKRETASHARIPSGTLNTPAIEAATCSSKAGTPMDTTDDTSTNLKNEAENKVQKPPEPQVPALPGCIIPPGGFPEDPKEDDYPDNCMGPQFTLTASLMRGLRMKCSLTSLSLEYCNIDFKMTNIRQFPPNLKKLSLRGTRCYNLPLNSSYLCKIQDQLPLLEYLDVSECEWFEPASLMPLSKLPRLRELRLRDCARLTECVAYASLATRYGFRQLRVLDVRGSPISDSEVSAVGWLPLLEELYCAPGDDFRNSSEHTHAWSEEFEEHQELEPWELQEPDYYRSKTPEPEDMELEEYRPEPCTADDPMLGAAPWWSHERRIIVIQPNADDGADNPTTVRLRTLGLHVEGVGPARLVEGAGPARLVEGAGPARLVEGAGPARLVEGAGPARLVEGAGPARLVEGAGPARLVEGAGPARLVEGAGPARLVEGAGPARLVEGAGPARLVEGAGPARLVEGAGPARLVEGAGPARLVEGAGPARLVEGAGPARLVEGAGPARLVEGAGPARLVEGAGPARLVEGAGPARLVEGAGPARLVEGAGPARLVEGAGPARLVEGAGPARLVEGAGPARLVEGAGPARLVEGAGPARLVEGAGPARLVEGAGPARLVEGAGPARVVEGAGPARQLEGAAPGALKRPHADNVLDLVKRPRILRAFDMFQNDIPVPVINCQDRPRANRFQVLNNPSMLSRSCLSRPPVNVRPLAAAPPLEEAPLQGEVPPQGEVPLQGEVPPQGEVPLQGDGSANEQAVGLPLAEAPQDTPLVKEPQVAGTSKDGAAARLINTPQADAPPAENASLQVIPIKNNLLIDVVPPNKDPQPVAGTSKDDPSDKPVNLLQANAPPADDSQLQVLPIGNDLQIDVVPPAQGPRQAGPPANRPLVGPVNHGASTSRNEVLRPRYVRFRRNQVRDVMHVNLDIHHQPAMQIGHPTGYNLVTDSAILRFGRADNDDINYINIARVGEGNPEPGFRPDRSNLRVLSVTGYQHITDRSLEHLATAAPHLRLIDFSQTSVSQNGVDMFKAIRPNCEVIFSEFGSGNN